MVDSPWLRADSDCIHLIRDYLETPICTNSSRKVDVIFQMVSVISIWPICRCMGDQDATLEERRNLHTVSGINVHPLNPFCLRRS